MSRNYYGLPGGTRNPFGSTGHRAKSEPSQFIPKQD
ncbi:hypothetical protein SAMN06269173_11148 [Hymenobacter mucosus]|uniref:Uncharacterized protein n=1 Tax=Hymenobacter mucosus TaxID=1411120 RepID=A0A239A811_9BACT|nr:hypothetical protein SAMN06269173_11148 [Hymenobacter mucosus]